MAATGQAPTATEYIVHHLTHLTSTGENQKFIVDFSVFNVDTIFFSVLVLCSVLLVLWLVARKVTSGVPGRFQAAIESLVRSPGSSALMRPESPEAVARASMTPRAAGP